MMETSTFANAVPRSNDPNSGFVDQDDLRTAFALAMSAMYKDEVALYGDLMKIVQEVNCAVIEEDQAKTRSSNNHRVWNSERERLDLERHGAIRLGSAQELQTIKRIFSLLGLHPVGYYDLSIADLPMHATAFRPLSQTSLARNPFRIFTTLLRPELLDPKARGLALSLINRRQIFSADLLQLLDAGESQLGRLTSSQAESFIAEAMKTFRWQRTASSSFKEYEILRAEHPILADVSCFGTAHINHLTPRTLDIDQAYSLMQERGLQVKDSIEGPSRREVPILLRQTSFLAREERTNFPVDTQSNSDGATNLIKGTHKARFGEIEQRGAALTPKGRSVYDAILEEQAGRTQSSTDSASTVGATHVEQIFAERLPDDWDVLLREELVYCLYRVNKGARAVRNVLNKPRSPATISQLLDAGVIEAVPQTYEDFLPISAAGIFRSNLTGDSRSSSSVSTVGSGSDIGTDPTTDTNTIVSAKPIQKMQQEQKLNWSFPDQQGLEDALGCAIVDPYSWYEKAQRESLAQCASVLGIEIEG